MFGRKTLEDVKFTEFLHEGLITAFGNFLKTSFKKK